MSERLSKKYSIRQNVILERKKNAIILLYRGVAWQKK